jgi:hypothetical protein
MRLTLHLPLMLMLVSTAIAGRVLAADAVVGSGTPTHCTETDFVTALDTVQASGGGTITFNCGGAHAVILGSSRTISSQVVIDGASVITLSGGNTTRLFHVGFEARLELRNITISNGYAASGNGGAIVNDQGSLHLQNVRFLNNHTSPEGGSGGAIASSRGPVTAFNSHFENNSAASGGAVYLIFGGANGTFTNTTFKDNSALGSNQGWGGAIVLWGGSGLTVRGCDFRENSARFGGAIHNQFANVMVVIEGTHIGSNTAVMAGGGLFLRAGTTNIDKSFIRGNEAVSDGGGIYSREGTLTVTDSTIAQNSAYFGGGIRTYDTIATLQGVTLVDNTASSSGGGIAHFGNVDAQLSLLNSTLTGNAAIDQAGGAIRVSGNPNATIAVELRHVTIANNVSGSASSSVGGIYTQVSSLTNFSLTLVNTVLSGNSSPTCLIPAAAASTARFSLWSDNSCTFGTSQQNHPNTQAALGPLADNGGWTDTHMPLADSPLIDNGICLTGVTADQRGASRPHGPACDIGAVEAGAVVDDSLFADGFEAANLAAGMESGREIH